MNLYFSKKSQQLTRGLYRFIWYPFMYCVLYLVSGYVVTIGLSQSFMFHFNPLCYIPPPPTHYSNIQLHNHHPPSPYNKQDIQKRSSFWMDIIQADPKKIPVFGWLLVANSYKWSLNDGKIALQTLATQYSQTENFFGTLSRWETFFAHFN